MSTHRGFHRVSCRIAASFNSPQATSACDEEKLIKKRSLEEEESGREELVRAREPHQSHQYTTSTSPLEFLLMSTGVRRDSATANDTDPSSSRTASLCREIFQAVVVQRWTKVVSRTRKIICTSTLTITS